MISRLPNLVQSERDNTYTDTKFPRMPGDGKQKWCAMYNGCSDAQHLGWRAGWWRCWVRSPACWRGRCRGPGSPCSYPPQRTGPHTHPAHCRCSPALNPISQYFDLAGELQQLILLIFHNPQYCVVPADMQRPLYVLMGHCLTFPFLIISKPSDKSIKDNYHQTEACILNHLVSLFVCVSLY